MTSTNIICNKQFFDIIKLKNKQKVKYICSSLVYQFTIAFKI